MPLRSTQDKSSLIQSEFKGCGKRTLVRLLREKRKDKKVVLRVKNIFAQRFVTLEGEGGNETISLRKREKKGNRQRWLVERNSKASNKKRGVFTMKNLKNKYLLTVVNNNMKKSKLVTYLGDNKKAQGFIFIVRGRVKTNCRRKGFLSLIHI